MNLFSRRCSHIRRRAIAAAGFGLALFVSLPLAAQEAGWKPLFNGRDLTGWKMTGPGEFKVEDGHLVTYGGMGLLWYEEEKIGNAELRIVFKTERANDNSGVFIRIREKPEDEWYAVHNGYEVQIDNGGDDSHRTGALYSLTQVEERVETGAGEEVTMLIRLEGDRTRVWVNGTLVTEYREGQPVPERQASYEPERGPRPVMGYIGLQNHDNRAKVMFKEVSMRPIAPREVPGAIWRVAESPEALGWSSEGLAAARDYAATLDTAGVMLIHQGVVLDRWGDVERKFSLHSIRKSFLSALYGPFVHEGVIDTGKTLAELGIDDNEPALSEIEKQAKVIDLLRARSGVYHPALAETANMRAAKPERHSQAPGTHFYYNNWDFNTLGAIFNQETGSDLFVELKRRIADPIGMEDLVLEEDLRYQRGRASIHPAYPMRMSARDMARFGLLMLREGMWGAEQLIPSQWVRESTASYSTAISHNDGANVGGYGYMWWVAVEGRHYPGVELPEGSYSARGVGGHAIIVIPAYDLVVVHRVNTFERGRAVSGEQTGELLRLILEAKNPARPH